MNLVMQHDMDNYIKGNNMGLNVFKDYPYSKKYYLLHPWKFLKHSYYNIRDFIWRGTKGFAPSDTWNLDSWLLQVLPAALKYLAEHSHGWPSNEKFPKFEDCQDCEGNNKNEYYNDYMNQFNDWDNKWKKDEHGNLVYKPEQSELDKKYFNRLKELSVEQQTLLEDTFNRLSKILYACWD